MALENQSVTLVDSMTISSNTISEPISLMRQGMANDKSNVQFIVDITALSGTSGPGLDINIFMPVAGKDYPLDVISTRTGTGQTIHFCAGVPSVIKLQATVQGIGTSVTYSLHALRV